jgi:hypothetical protein
MKRASEFTREFASGLVDLHVKQAQPGELVGNVIGFALVFGLLCAMAYGLFLDCGGATC